jgi:hypothetical protein
LWWHNNIFKKDRLIILSRANIKHNT